MIVRALLRLLSLAALAVAGWWIGRIVTGAAKSPGARRKTNRALNQGAMVRDRVCNTFLPRSTALEAQIGGQTHFFCSEGCRRRFLNESEASKTA